VLVDDRHGRGMLYFVLFIYLLRGEIVTIVGCTCKMHHRACDERYSFLMTFVVVEERKRYRE